MSSYGGRPPSAGSGNTSWMTQHAARHHPPRPGAEVGARRLDAVPAVDEQQRQRRTPPSAHGLRAADDGDDLLLEPGGADRAAEGGQGVHHAELVVDEGVVVVLPAGLVLLGAAVVVDGEHGPADLARGRAEPDRRLAAVGADLERRTVGQPLARPPVEQRALVLGHEALRRAGVGEQVVRHHGREPQLWRSHTRRPSNSGVGTNPRQEQHEQPPTVISWKRPDARRAATDVLPGRVRDEPHVRDAVTTSASTATARTSGLGACRRAWTA